MMIVLKYWMGNAGMEGWMKPAYPTIQSPVRRLLRRPIMQIGKQSADERFWELVNHCVSMREKYHSSETVKHLHNACMELLLAAKSLPGEVIPEAIIRKTMERVFIK